MIYLIRLFHKWSIWNFMCNSIKRTFSLFSKKIFCVNFLLELFQKGIILKKIIEKKKIVENIKCKTVELFSLLESIWWIIQHFTWNSQLIWSVFSRFLFDILKKFYRSTWKDFFAGIFIPKNTQFFPLFRYIFHRK